MFIFKPTSFCLNTSENAHNSVPPSLTDFPQLYISLRFQSNSHFLYLCIPIPKHFIPYYVVQGLSPRVRYQEHSPAGRDLIWWMDLKSRTSTLFFGYHLRQSRGGSGGIVPIRGTGGRRRQQPTVQENRRGGRPPNGNCYCRWSRSVTVDGVDGVRTLQCRRYGVLSGTGQWWTTTPCCRVRGTETRLTGDSLNVGSRGTPQSDLKILVQKQKRGREGTKGMREYTKVILGLNGSLTRESETNTPRNGFCDGKGTNPPEDQRQEDDDMKTGRWTVPEDGRVDERMAPGH